MAEPHVDFEPLMALENLVANKIDTSESDDFVKENGLAGAEDEITTKNLVSDEVGVSVRDDENCHELINSSIEESELDAELHLPSSENDIITSENEKKDTEADEASEQNDGDVTYNDSMNDENDSFSLRLRDDSELEDRGEYDGIDVDENIGTEEINANEEPSETDQSNLNCYQTSEDPDLSLAHELTSPTNVITHEEEQNSLDLIQNIQHNLNIDINTNGLSTDFIKASDSSLNNFSDVNRNEDELENTLSESIGEYIDESESNKNIEMQSEKIDNLSNFPNLEPNNELCSEQLNDVNKHDSELAIDKCDPSESCDENITIESISTQNTVTATLSLPADVLMEQGPMQSDVNIEESSQILNNNDHSVIHHSEVGLHDQVQFQQDEECIESMDTEPTVTASGQTEESEHNQPSESPQLPTPSTGPPPTSATPPTVPTNSLSAGDCSENNSVGDCSSGDNSNGEAKVSVGQGDVGVTEFNWDAVHCVYCESLVLEHEPKLLPCLHSACHKCVSHEAAQPTMKDDDIVPSKFIDF